MNDNYDLRSNNGGVSLLSLPIEVRVKVYKCLEYKTTLTLRLVNEQLKTEINEHLNFYVKLDQGYRGFRKLCRYRVKSAKVVNLTYQNLPKGPLFLYPSKLQRLVLDGNISLQNFLKIVGHCDRLEVLRVTHETLGQHHRLLSSRRVEKILETNLRHLTTLSVQLLRYPLDDPLQPVRNIEVLLSLHLPSLTTFKLFFSLWGDWLPLLKFLSRHADTLKNVELQVGDRGDSRNTETFLRSNPHSGLLQSVDVAALRRLSLQSFSIRDDVLNLNPTVKGLLLQILQNQKRLERLEFHSPGDLTITDVRGIVQQNEATLTEIVIYHVKNYLELPGVQVIGGAGPTMRLVMDASVFSNCKNLKTLALSCGNSRSGVVDLGNIKLVRLDRLPCSLERLHLTSFTLNVDEVVRLSAVAREVREVLIVDAGSMKYSLVLKNFLANCVRLEYLNVRPVVTRASNEEGWFSEVRELSELYGYFMGVPFDPIDDLEGFEAKIAEKDRSWIVDNVDLVQ